MSLKNPVTPPGIDPGTVRLVAQRLNQYAAPGPNLFTGAILKISKSLLIFKTLKVTKVKLSAYKP